MSTADKLVQRQVYLTQETRLIKVMDLIRVCYVFPKSSIAHDDFEDWLLSSPDHFYIEFAFPSMQVHSWSDRVPLSAKDLPICAACISKRVRTKVQTSAFLRHMQTKPLATLDLFGGTGAFALGMAEGSGILKLTHAIEISPSAAQTYQ